MNEKPSIPIETTAGTEPGEADRGWTDQEAILRPPCRQGSPFAGAVRGITQLFARVTRASKGLTHWRILARSHRSGSRLMAASPLSSTTIHTAVPGA